MRIGLAGVGRIGAFHAETLKAVADVDTLVRRGRRARSGPRRRRRLGVESVESPEALFGAGIDGLVIAAATSAHAALVVAGVEAGLPTFCEKPVADDVDGTLAVLAKVDGSDVPVHIGFQRRFDAGYVAARAAVQSGSLGWIHTHALEHPRPGAAAPRSTSPLRAASSATAACTTSTASAG